MNRHEKRVPTTSAVLRNAIFLASFPFGILMFALPIYGHRLGASALEIGGLFSAFSLMTVLLRPLVGRALDRYGRRWFLLLGLFSYAVAMILFLLSSQVAMLYLARAAQGIGSALLWISAYSMVADLSPAEARGGRFGRVDEASARGAMYGTFIGFTVLGFLGMSKGWTVLFGGYALLSFYALWMAWRGIRETRPPDPAQQSNTNTKRPLSRQLIALMGIVFLTGASSALVRPLLMIFLQDHFSTEVDILALAFLPSALIYSFLPSRMGRIGDRWGRKWPMMAGLLVSALVSLFLPNLSSLLWLILLWAIEALGYTAATPAQEALVADLTGQERRGTAYGLYTFAASLGAVVGPLIGGWLYDAQGHAVPFYVNAAGLALSAVLIALFIRDQLPGT